MWSLTGDNAVSKPGRSLLPVLIILFLVSYGLLTMLVFLGILLVGYIWLYRKGALDWV